VTPARVRLLGPIDFVTARGERIELPSAAQRRVVAVLALAAGATQRADYLSDVLEVSAGSLRTTVSRLRSTIGADVIRTNSTGYRIACATDATMFTDRLVEQPDHPDRLAVLDDALALWRGPVLDEFAHESWAAPEVARLDELHALAIEDRADVLIMRSRSSEAIAALEPHCAANPLRDRPRGLLMQALASAGRQADALRAYQEYRAVLIDETGTEPSDFVRSVERRVAAGWHGGEDSEREPELRTRGAAEDRHALDTPLHRALVDATELIGRQREMTWLESDLVAARSGSMRTVLLGGEAGLGKSTLLAAFGRAQHQQGGNVVIYGGCTEGLAVPLEPFRSIVAGLVERAPVALLRQHCERCGGELSRIAPQLLTRLWAPVPLSGDDATVRHQLFDAIADLLRRVACNGSLTLIVEDLHWAEPTALLLLRHLSRTLVDAPILLLASYRDTGEDVSNDLRAALADLEKGRCRRIPLSGFDDAELTRLVQSVTGTEEGLGVDVLLKLRDETGGNPLYAAQLVAHLWESGHLFIEDGFVGLGEVGIGSSIPRNLLEVVWSRVQSLGDRAVAVLRTASALGVAFAEETVAAMMQQSERDVVPALDAALRARILDDTGDARQPLRFTHALVAHALYQELSPAQRRRLHARAVEVLQGDDAPSPEIVVELARHSALAGDLLAAERWAVAAAEHAYAHLAPTEAATWYEKALEYATERGVPDAERADLMARLGESQHRAGDLRTRVTLIDAARLAEQSGAHDALVRAALANDRGFVGSGTPNDEQLAALDAAIAVADPADVTTMARLLACRAQELVHTPHHELRMASARQAIELAGRSDDPTLMPLIIPALVFGLWGPDTLALRRQLIARAVAAAVDTRAPLLEFSANRAAYYVGVESAHAIGAAVSLGRMKEIARDIGEPRLRWTCAVFEGFEATMRGKFEAAERQHELVFELGTEVGEPDAFSTYAAQLFVNRSFAGRYEEVIPLLEATMETAPEFLTFRIAHAICCSVTDRQDEARAVLEAGLVAGFAEIPFEWIWMTTVIGYAVLAIELQHVSAAEDLYPLIEPFADQVAFNGFTSQGYVGAYVGKLASLMGKHDVADAHLHKALEVNLEFGWRYHEATTLVALALSQKRRCGSLDERGREWLDRAQAISTECGMAIVDKQIADVRSSW
jgi:DNA-binding SARP family transcriptional activator